MENISSSLKNHMQQLQHPSSSNSTLYSSVSVYINPKFKNAYINPNFLNKSRYTPSIIHNANNNNINKNSTINNNNNAYNINNNDGDADADDNNINSNNNICNNNSNIHLNPKFIAKISTENNTNILENSVDTKPKECVIKAQITTMPNRKLIRNPSKNNNNIKIASFTDKINVQHSRPLIKIGQRKLIRVLPYLKNSPLINKSLISVASEKKPLTTKYKIVKDNKINPYRIDRRPIVKNYNNYKLKPVEKEKISRRSDNFTTKKVIITDRKLLRIGNSDFKKKLGTENKYASKRSVNDLSNSNKKLAYLNINGVLYKSTQNKLQKTDGALTKSIKQTKSILPKLQEPTVLGLLPRKIGMDTNQTNGTDNNIRSLYIRGEKFILDPSGRKLMRIHKIQKSTMKRIDIGGLTFVEKSDNTYVRTDIHKTRNYLTIAKQKSINVLSKKFVKINLPCEIFRKIGKCLANNSGRCAKMHDPKTIVICSKFLKGSCVNNNCLLSHDVNLSKMPTCKFYLLGMCNKNNCPYLHKKVSDKTNICEDFLKGFCEKAEKCNKKHQFINADNEINNKGLSRSSIHNNINNNNNNNNNINNNNNNDNDNDNKNNNNNYDNKKREMEIIVNNSLKSINKDEKLIQPLFNDTKFDKSRYFFNESNNIKELKYEMDDLQLENGSEVVNNIEENVNNKKFNVLCTTETIDNTSINNIPVEYIHNEKRPKLGVLPSYIPID